MAWLGGGQAFRVGWAQGVYSDPLGGPHEGCYKGTLALLIFPSLHLLGWAPLPTPAMNCCHPLPPQGPSQWPPTWILNLQICELDRPIKVTSTGRRGEGFMCLRHPEGRLQHPLRSSPVHRLQICLPTREHRGQSHITGPPSFQPAKSRSEQMTGNVPLFPAKSAWETRRGRTAKITGGLRRGAESRRQAEEPS